MKIPRALLTLIATLILALSGCGGDSGDSSPASRAATTPNPAVGSGGVSDDPSRLSASEKAANLIRRVPGAARVRLRLGSKSSAEEVVLGEIYTQALEAAGYRIEKDLDLGPAPAAHRALRRGRIDAYPEQTDTALTSFFGVKVVNTPRDPAQAFQIAKQDFAKEQIKAFDPTPFGNAYRLAMTVGTAKRLADPTRTSQLTSRARDLVVNGVPECRRRADCLPALRRAYGQTFKRFLPGQSTYLLLDHGNADVAIVLATDGSLASGRYRVLDDDRDAFPPGNVTLVMRQRKAQRFGAGGEAVVKAIQRHLTNGLVRKLNARVVIDQDSPIDAAKAYLKQFGYVK